MMQPTLRDELLSLVADAAATGNKLEAERRAEDLWARIQQARASSKKTAPVSSPPSWVEGIEHEPALAGDREAQSDLGRCVHERAGAEPAVLRFRARHFPDGLLDDLDDLRNWVARRLRSEAKGTGRPFESDRRLPIPSRRSLGKAQMVRVVRGGVLAELASLAEALSARYRISPEQATALVTAKTTPSIAPIRSSFEARSDFPELSRIVIEAHPRTPAAEIAAVYSRRRQAVYGRGPYKVKDKVLRLTEHVLSDEEALPLAKSTESASPPADLDEEAHRLAQEWLSELRARGEKVDVGIDVIAAAYKRHLRRLYAGDRRETKWHRLYRTWNETYPSGHPWHYTRESNFRRDFANARKTIQDYYALSEDRLAKVHEIPQPHPGASL